MRGHNYQHADDSGRPCHARDTARMTTGPVGGQRPTSPDPGRAHGRRDTVPANAGRSTEPHTTRAAMIWTAVVAALIVFILLIVFFIQNQDTVEVHFLGLTGPVPLGVALFIAAVAGGVLVAVAGAVRIIQLRAMARRATRPSPSEPPPRPGSTPPQDR